MSSHRSAHTHTPSPLPPHPAPTWCVPCPAELSHPLTTEAQHIVTQFVSTVSGNDGVETQLGTYVIWCASINVKMNGHLHSLLHAHSILECMPTTSFSALQFPRPNYPLLHTHFSISCSVCSAHLLECCCFPRCTFFKTRMLHANDMQGFALKIATVAAEAMNMEHEHQDEPKAWGIKV